MKAITVQQPWAWAIIHGGKDVENRQQLWRYRGPLAIHAGLTDSPHGWADPLVARAHRDAGSPAEGIHHGAIVGVVDLLDVHYSNQGHRLVDGCCRSEWADQWAAKVHLVLANPRPLVEPIRCRGALGLWTPAPYVLDRLKAAANA